MFHNPFSERIPIPKICWGNLFFFTVPKIELQFSFARGRALEGLICSLLFSERATGIYSSIINSFKDLLV